MSWKQLSDKKLKQKEVKHHKEEGHHQDKLVDQADQLGLVDPEEDLKTLTICKECSKCNKMILEGRVCICHLVLVKVGHVKEDLPQVIPTIVDLHQEIDLQDHLLDRHQEHLVGLH